MVYVASVGDVLGPGSFGDFGGFRDFGATPNIKLVQRLGYSLVDVDKPHELGTVSPGKAVVLVEFTCSSDSDMPFFPGFNSPLALSVYICVITMRL
jgi:hypothetical protein